MKSFNISNLVTKRLFLLEKARELIKMGGGPNKSRASEIFSKKNKRESPFIRDLTVAQTNKKLFLIEVVLLKQSNSGCYN